MSGWDEELMLKAAETEWPREACGYVFGTGLTVQMQNIARDGRATFIMDLPEQYKVYAEHGTPVAVWHSHPNDDPNPSPADLDWHPEGMRMLIVADGKVHDHGFPGS